jgi:hypothetical protein
MTHRIIITGKPATISAQLAEIQSYWLLNGGPRIGNADEALIYGGPRIEPLPITSESGFDGRRT